LDQLSEIRRTLRTRVQRSPIGDTTQYVKALEAHYREMWTAKSG